jgi:4'-phosphopantetheinyl transferase EntD
MSDASSGLSTALTSLYAIPVSSCIGPIDGLRAPLFPGEALALGNTVRSRFEEFAAGRNASRQALIDLGYKPCSIPIGQNRAPEWPLGIIGSISHSKTLCCAVVARSIFAEGIGVDIEDVQPLPLEVTRLICTDAEIKSFQLESSSGTAWENVCFSAKEALFKACYPLTRTFLDFKDVSLWFKQTELLSGSFGISHSAPALTDKIRKLSIDGRWHILGKTLLAGVTIRNTQS